MKATNNAPAIGHLSRLEKMYNQMLIDLRSVIESKYESVSAFAKSTKHGYSFEVKNLYRVFSEENPQRMSLELYVRICSAVGVGGARMKNQVVGVSNIALIDYLVLDNDIILKSSVRLLALAGACADEEGEGMEYAATVASIKAIIKKRFGSVDAFCKAQAEAGAPFERSNLARVLSAHSGQQMGLDLFVRLCVALKVGGERMAAQRVGAANIRFSDYLAIDNDAVNQSFADLQYQDFV